MDFEGLKDLMSRQRAVRNFDLSRPVDDALIEELLRAAIRAPNGGNRQQWRFIVVREGEPKAQIASIYDGLVVQFMGGRPSGQTPWRNVPVLIAVCTESPDPGMPVVGGSAATAFPAVQNLLLAAQALGLGSVLTTMWKQREAEVNAALGLPPGAEVHAILPIGWPERKYGRNKRRPFNEVTSRDRYGQPW